MDTRRPVALVGDEVLLDELLRLAAAAGCELDRVPDVAALRARWKDAPLVLLDEWAASECGLVDLPRRAGAYLVCTRPPAEHVWREALALGLERVVELPAGDQWLVGALADLAEGPPSGEGRVVAVLGGRGGAGASVLAAALGQAVLSSGGQGLLVDCDPLGGGLDLTLGDESHEGPRWPELHLSGGRVAASALHSALPGRTGKGGRLTVLSCDRDGPGPEPDAVAAVVEAGRRAGETVICDLPRHLTASALAALTRADLTVLVVPAEVRACAAAKRVAHQLISHGATLGVVVRAPGPTGLRGKEIADTIGATLLTSMRPEPRLASALDNGRFPTATRGPLARAATAVLAALHAD
ncbi:septum site-determining protein Ssd [Umezawaea tangerina]|uniref:Secretion/DNA translocation related CpaE-like protein n=1 Tax=Umezawaea tangerina TaxID=84725 RepID=A0A2T0TKJ9_9PSEU|nr:septum site-determining protein Ssd [Umezawaea tangerina]PRY46206.1 secretion/DNA translocation related CpaE-like protein [Umezawaea tangerina]